MILLICGAGVVAAFQVGKAAIALPVLRSDLDLSLVAAGWVLSMLSVVGATAGSTIGALSGRVSDRGAVVAGLCLVSVAGLAGALAPGAGALLVARFAEGLGFIVVTVAAPSILARLAQPKDYRLVFALWSTYFPAGSMIMLLLGPWLLPFGWRWFWAINAGLVLAFALAFAAATGRIAVSAGRARGRERRPGSLLRDLHRTVSAQGPLRLALCFGAYTLQYASLSGFLPTILVEREGFGAGAAGALTAFAILANLAGNLLAGWILRSVPRPMAIAAGLGGMGVCAIGIFAGALPFAVVYGLLLVLSVVGGIVPAAVVAGVPAHAPAPDLVPTTNGLVVQGSHLGQLAGPPLLGALAASAGGWQLSPIVFVTAAGIGVIIAIGLRRYEPHP